MVCGEQETLSMQIKPIALLLTAAIMTAGAAHADQGCNADTVKAQAAAVADVTVASKLSRAKPAKGTSFTLAPYARLRVSEAMQNAANDPAAAIGGTAWLNVKSDADVLAVLNREVAASRADLIADSCLPYAYDVRQAVKRYIVQSYVDVTHAEVYLVPAANEWGRTPEARAMAAVAVYFGPEDKLLQLSAPAVKGE